MTTEQLFPEPNSSESEPASPHNGSVGDALSRPIPTDAALMAHEGDYTADFDPEPADQALEYRLREEISTLNRTVWENRIGPGDLDRWLERFETSEDAVALGHDDGATRLHALFLLSQFLYFGDREVRALLRTLFEEFIRYPVVSELRRALNDTLKIDDLYGSFELALRRTRFLGVGNPSESGPHLLYYFRQENRLGKELFRNVYELLDRTDKQCPVLREPSVLNYVFIDDFCGTGEQATEFYHDAVEEVRVASVTTGNDVRFSYLALAARTDGLEYVRQNSMFDQVDSVLKLDSSFETFSDVSRYFQPPLPEGISKSTAEQLCFYFGSQLWPYHPLGYQNSALMLGFRHNTPDNTLPIFWFGEERSGWFPIFRRYHKK